MLFEVDLLTKRFGGLTAVNEMTFGIDKGEIVAVFGPNGSGKTTLLNLIAGLIRPTSGRLMWKGRDITGRKPHEIAQIGIVKTFQNPQLFNELPVFQHVLIAAHLRLKRQLGWRRIATLLRSDDAGPELVARVERVLALCRLTEVSGELAANLSYGAEKMLGVAMALMCDPDLLLLDEPATGLGQDEIANLDAVLRDLRDHGTTLCVIDHKVGFLGRLADRAIAMRGGTKLAEGSPAAVLNDPAVIEAYLGHQHA